MHVDFGGLDALVPEHLLDGAQVGSSLEQMGGKGMPQGVWTHGFPDTRPVAQVLDDVENHHASEAVAASVEEEDVLASGLCLRALSPGCCVFVPDRGLSAPAPLARWVPSVACRPCRQRRYIPLAQRFAIAASQPAPTPAVRIRTALR